MLDEDCSEVVTFKEWDAITVEKDTCSSNADCGSEYNCAQAGGWGETRACVVSDYAWENHLYSAKEGTEFLDAMAALSRWNVSIPHHRNVSLRPRLLPG